MKKLLTTLVVLISIASPVLCPVAFGQLTMATSYTQDFNSIGTALPDGWGVWTNSTITGNGSAFNWSGTPIANNAAATVDTYFRNLPGASQTWTAGLSSGTDRALGWRAGSAASRDGSITFTLANTSGHTFTGMSFQLFTPNSAGTAGMFNLEYQLGALGTFSQLASVSYTNDIAQNPLSVTSITLTALNLTVLNDQSQQVTLRINNTATTGTTFNTLAIDNFSYTAIPESSTYAAIMGLLTLGLVLLRRRKKA